MSAEATLRDLIGGMVFQIAALTAENQQLKTELAKRESAPDRSESPA